jgi:hypothetical protein
MTEVPMHLPRVLSSSVLFSVVWLAGCDCSGPGPATPCTSDSQCEADQACIDGMCRPVEERDAGPNTCAVDFDRDGRCADDDCDDNDRSRGGPEVCDEIDNDCDGNTDETISEICRDCAAGCEGHHVPGPEGWMPTEENAEGVIVDDDGAITLGREENRAFAVWVANMDEGTVSKLDSRTANEVARYPTINATAPAGVSPWDAPCNWSNSGNCPSRTAVDQNFDAYVANRAFGQQGTITKYANREADCIDRNGNGMIDTSRDLNDDGTIELGTAEFVGVDDECILWTVPVGDNDAVPRALAIGLVPPDGLVGDVWVGLFNQRQACRLDPFTGATSACMDISSFQPYGAAADSAGRIWLLDRSGARRDFLGYIDTGPMSFTPVAALPDTSSCATGYGITVDGAGDVFVANDCPPQVWRYRHTTAEWNALTFPGTGTARGLAADESHLWVALSHSGDNWGGTDQNNRIVRFNLADMSYDRDYLIPTGRQPIGIGVSFDGSIWSICQYNSMASRLDPTAGADGTWIEHGVGLHPYTYSDFMGFGLNVFAEPRGHYQFVVEGCGGGTNNWTGAAYDAEVPAGTSVTLFARVADRIEDLAALPWIGPFEGNPANFLEPPGPLPRGHFIEIDIRLATTDRTAAPRVFDIDVAGVCEPILE